jgi:hypothetical protein
MRIARIIAQGFQIFSHNGKEYCLVWVPPSPCRAQNLENRDLSFRLPARSLSLQELCAKSRDHGSYGREADPFAFHFGNIIAGFGSQRLGREISDCQRSTIIFTIIH